MKDAESGGVLKDFLVEGERWVFLEGGLGGKGNTHFKSSRVQAPRFAQPGMPGKLRRVKIELNIIADIGFVGFPNAGKSSLLAILSNARPEVADYPFTTKRPNLGVMRGYEEELVLADIPGIIQGASQGAGLGLKFLRHIARTAALAFLVDLSSPDWRTAFDILREELRGYSFELAQKKRILVATKLDVEEARRNFPLFREKYGDERVVGISALTRTGLEELKREFGVLVKEASRAAQSAAARLPVETGAEEAEEGL
jgi:GTP-binding protein